MMTVTEQEIEFAVALAELRALIAECKAMRNDLQAIMGIADVETREAIRARLELASASWQCWPVQGHA